MESNQTQGFSWSFHNKLFLRDWWHASPPYPCRWSLGWIYLEWPCPRLSWSPGPSWTNSRTTTTTWIFSPSKNMASSTPTPFDTNSPNRSHEKCASDQLLSEQAIRCQVLHTVLHISDQRLKGENSLWSHLGLKKIISNLLYLHNLLQLSVCLPAPPVLPVQSDLSVFRGFTVYVLCMALPSAPALAFAITSTCIHSVSHLLIICLIFQSGERGECLQSYEGSGEVVRVRILQKAKGSYQWPCSFISACHTILKLFNLI